MPELILCHLKDYQLMLMNIEFSVLEISLKYFKMLNPMPFLIPIRSMPRKTGLFIRI